MVGHSVIEYAMGSCKTGAWMYTELRTHMLGRSRKVKISCPDQRAQGGEGHGDCRARLKKHRCCPFTPQLVGGPRAARYPVFFQELSEIWSQTGSLPGFNSRQSSVLVLTAVQVNTEWSEQMGNKLVEKRLPAEIRLHLQIWFLVWDLRHTDCFR